MSSYRPHEAVKLAESSADLRNKMLIASLLLSSVLGGTVSLYGQDQTGAAGTQPAITTDRPAVTDSSIVLPSGDLLFENGFTETGNQGQRSFDFPETLVRFGLTSKTELRFTADYFNNFNNGAGFGFGWGTSLWVRSSSLLQPRQASMLRWWSR
jgi:hypothetical protein